MPAASSPSDADTVRISVVTVVRNAAATIERTLRSVAGQDHPACECVVIDGGSTDGTAEILARWRERIAVLHSGPDRGIYDAMNKGLARCSGELVCMLNADDWFAGPGVLSAVARRYREAAAGLPAGSPRLLAVHGDFLLWMPWAGLVSYRRSSASTRFGMRLNHQSLFVHRDVHTRLGDYDLGCGLAGDFDLVVRMADAGVRFVHLAEPVAVFAKGGAGDRRWFRFLLEVAAVLRRHRGRLARLVFLAAAARSVAGRLALAAFTRLGLRRLVRWGTALAMGARDDAAIRSPWCETGAGA